jgi:hypothetical protein
MIAIVSPAEDSVAVDSRQQLQSMTPTFVALDPRGRWRRRDGGSSDRKLSRRLLRVRTPRRRLDLR